MTFFGFVIGGLLPRVLLIYYWLATTLVDRALGTFIIPLIGVIFLPFTTLSYVLVYNPIVGSVIGANWLWVVLGFAIDAFTYSLNSYRPRGVHA